MTRRPVYVLPASGLHLSAKLTANDKPKCIFENAHVKGQGKLSEDVMHVEIEKPRINPMHFGAIIIGALVNAFILGGVWVSLGNSIAANNEKTAELSDRLDKEAGDRKERLRDYQVTMTGINAQIAQIPALQFKQEQQAQLVAENKAGLAETNKRIDRVVESFGGKLDTVIDNVNKVATQVQVLSSKLDDMQGRTKRTEFETLFCPEDKPIPVKAYCRSRSVAPVVPVPRAPLTSEALLQ